METIEGTLSSGTVSESNLKAALNFSAKWPEAKFFPAIYRKGHKPLIKWSRVTLDDPDDLKRWSKKSPEIYFCISLKDSNLTVIDVDQKHGKDGFASLEFIELIDGPLPSTLTVKTPTGGRHLYYKGWVRQTVEHLGRGLDSPTMVPCPQSIVPGKKGVYAIIRDGKIPVLPDFIKEQLIVPSNRSKKNPNSKSKPLVELDRIANIQRARLYARQEAEPAIEGDGGDAGTYLTAATIKDFGVSREVCFAIMVEQYNPRCQPPWSQNELKKKIKNAYAYGNNPPGINTAEADFNKATDAFMTGSDSLNSDKSSDTNPRPLPLIDKIDPLPYPTDALPSVVQNAVEEVLAFTKAPVPLVASSALAAVSLAVQAHIDVKRADKLIGPTNLFLLSIADSGERKSTCDKFFTTAIKEYQNEQAEAAGPELKNRNAALEAWSAKRLGLTAKIKQLTKNGKPTEEYENALQELEHQKPKQLRVPKLLLGDETPESLAYRLAHEWPSGGVISSEAGAIFGSHAMGRDAIMRNLALLNLLWDGDQLSIGRRTSESYTLRGARLTMGLQIQESTLRSFFARSEGLPRGTGFLARFLIAWPESTQGTRLYAEPPAHWPAVDAFNRRIAEILDIPAPVEEEGFLWPDLIGLSTEAKKNWVAFHDAIEKELGNGGRFFDVRDIASKTGDNVVRLAALFHMFEDGLGGEINEKYIQSAGKIVKWHLHEARRFLGEIALSEEEKNTILLNEWLLDHCRKEAVDKVSYRKIQQYGPSPLRRKEKLTTAISELEILDRISVIFEGRRKMIQVNPELIKFEG